MLLPYVKCISVQSKNFDLVAAGVLSFVPCLFLLNLFNRFTAAKKGGKQGQVRVRDWMLSSSETVIMGMQTSIVRS